MLTMNPPVPVCISAAMAWICRLGRGSTVAVASLGARGSVTGSVQRAWVPSLVLGCCSVLTGGCTEPDFSGTWALSIPESEAGLIRSPWSLKLIDDDGDHWGYSLFTDALRVEGSGKGDDISYDVPAWRETVFCREEREIAGEKAAQGWSEPYPTLHFPRAEGSVDGTELEFDIHFDDGDEHGAVRWECRREYDEGSLLICTAICSQDTPKAVLRRLESSAPDYPSSCPEWADRYGDSMDQVSLLGPFPEKSYDEGGRECEDLWDYR